MKLRLLVKIILMEIVLGPKVTVNQAMRKIRQFGFFMKICDPSFHFYTAKNVYRRFSDII